MTIPTVAAVAVTAGVVAVTAVGAIDETETIGWFDFILKLAGVLMPFGLAYMAYKQAAMEKTQTKIETTAVSLVKSQGELATTAATLETDVKELKVHTNSIKDALVAETDRAALAEGKLQGRADLLVEQATPAAVDKPVGDPVPVTVKNEDAIKVQAVRPTPNRAVEPGDKGKA